MRLFSMACARAHSRGRIQFFLGPLFVISTTPFLPNSPYDARALSFLMTLILSISFGSISVSGSTHLVESVLPFTSLGNTFPSRTIKGFESPVKTMDDVQRICENEIVADPINKINAMKYFMVKNLA